MHVAKPAKNGAAVKSPGGKSCSDAGSHGAQGVSMARPRVRTPAAKAPMAPIAALSGRATTTPRIEPISTSVKQAPNHFNRCM